MVERKEQLIGLISEIKKAAWAGIDTEADSLHSYPEKLCLLQISLPGRDALVDALAGMDLTSLFKALKEKELILHGSDNDLRLMYRTYHFVPSRMFDTMWAARLLGYTAFGLNDLLSKLLGIQLDKGSQKANWARRPLTQRMINYAYNDSRHLRPLADLLRGQLEEKGRLDWHRQICSRLIQDYACDRPLDENSVWRLKGSSKLNRRGLAALREAFYWREREAIRANRPPYFVIRHEDLISLAQTISDHENPTRWPSRLSARSGKGLREAVNQAMKLPFTDCPEIQRSVRRRITEKEKKTHETLKVRRDAKAKELGIDPTLIASRSTLVKLCLENSAERNQLHSWQRELLEI